MVRDNNTGLIWEVKTDDKSIHDKDKYYDFYSANEFYISRINSKGFGGFSDWRIPTAKELTTITNLGRWDPVINKIYFPHLGNNFPSYWSSTIKFSNTTYAFYVSFYDGHVTAFYRTREHNVRAVRGGQARSLDYLIINGDGTVTDKQTGLMWQQGETKEMTWEAALRYCEKLTLAGYDDWRLPNTHELRSILDYKKYAPATDKKIFKGIRSSVYWTSTTFVRYTSTVFCIGFSDGIDRGGDGKSSVRYVRAVRSGHGTGSSDYLVVSGPEKPEPKPNIAVAKPVNTNTESTDTLLASTNTQSNIKPATIQQAAEFPPPVVVIASPANGDTISSDQTDVRAVIKSKQPLKKIEVFVNGKPVLNPAERGIVIKKKREKQEKTFQISLDAGENTLIVRAHTAYAFGEDRVTVHNQKTPSRTSMLPRLFLLSIGVGNYPKLGETEQLNYTAAAAKGIARAFKKIQGRLFREVHVKLLADGEPLLPTSDNIEDSLPFLRQAGQYDVAILFMAGHGIRDDRGGYFFLPSDAEKRDADSFRSSRLIKWSDIKDALDIPANVIAFLDTCHAGALFQKGKLRAPDTNTLIRDLIEQGNTVFAASTGDEYSQESDRWGHGAFTKAILEGLEHGKADLIKDQDNKISMKELDTYVSSEVPKMTDGAQHPVTYSPEGYQDFPVWVVR